MKLNCLFEIAGESSRGGRFLVCGDTLDEVKEVLLEVKEILFLYFWREYLNYLGNVTDEEAEELGLTIYSKKGKETKDA